MVAVIDYLIRHSLVKSSIYIATSLIVMVLINLKIDELKNPFVFNSISEFNTSNVIGNDINVLINSFVASFSDVYVLYLFIAGLIILNISVIINILTYYKEVSMPYSLGFLNPIREFEWQNKNIKVSHDRFVKIKNNSIFYKNSIAIDLQKYENSKNKIVQYLNLPNNHEVEIVPWGRKGVEIKFFSLPMDSSIEAESYQLNKINYGLDADGIYFIDILKQTHLLCVGESGSGKSNFMHHLLKSVFVNIKSIENLTLVDLKGTELYRYRYLKHVDFIDDIEGVLETLKSLKSEMNSRFEEMKEKNEVLYRGEFRFVFIDEIGTIGTHPNKKLRDEIFALMIELFQKGRAAKILFFIFAQKIDSTNIPSNVLANIQTKVLMKTDSDFNINNTIGTKESIEKITHLDVDSFPRGRAIVKNGDNSEKVLVQIPFVQLHDS